MTLAPAPFFSDMAGASDAGAAHWAQTSDGLRIRVGHWRPEKARGTVLLFPGRTEYIEKYALTAQEFGARGFAMLAVDWRGQGLADRVTQDPRLGHVEHFPDYQKDVAAALNVAQSLDLPRPFHLLGHSMGGAIGLRAVLEGMQVETCAFTGPMWGIYMSPAVKPFGWPLSHLAPRIGLGTRLAPGTRYESYVTVEPFAGNSLTTDREMYEMMQAQAKAHPEVLLAGPTMTWLREALRECRYLDASVSPDLPCVTFLGEHEKIIDCPSVKSRMDRWPRGRLEIVAGAEHEVLMETPAIRKSVFDQLESLFFGTPPT